MHRHKLNILVASAIALSFFGAQASFAESDQNEMIAMMIDSGMGQYSFDMASPDENLADLIGVEHCVPFSSLITSSCAKDFMMMLVETWGQTAENRAKIIEVTQYHDGLALSFDEGLTIYFDQAGSLKAMYHWDHYSFGSNDAYRNIFNNIGGIDPRDEHEICFGEMRT